jgi:hypothetical protein
VTRRGGRCCRKHQLKVIVEKASEIGELRRVSSLSEKLKIRRAHFALSVIETKSEEKDKFLLLLKSVFLKSQDGVSFLDLDQSFLYFADSFRLLTGLTQSVWLFKHMSPGGLEVRSPGGFNTVCLVV